MIPLLRWLPLLAIAVGAVVAGGCGDDAEPEGEPLPADVDVILEASAQAMGDVTSVRFDLDRSGAPVYIDEFKTLALDALVGRFAAPASADALLTVTVNDSLTTELGAVAKDGMVWLSNPVTGRFEPLDAGYDLDPTTFFDPEGGWRPLMANLQDAVLVGVENRNGAPRYHVHGTAPAEQMAAIAAGLVDDQDVEIDFWLERDTGLVRAAEFSTEHDGGVSDWVLELSDYGEDFTIEAPPVDG